MAAHIWITSPNYLSNRSDLCCEANICVHRTLFRECVLILIINAPWGRTTGSEWTDGQTDRQTDTLLLDERP